MINLDQNSQYLWNIFFFRRSIWAFWNSFTDEHNTFIPKSTKRSIKLNKFAFGTPWVQDLLCKHWFTSSVWNFCHWVSDFPPCKTSPAVRSEEKRLFHGKLSLTLITIIYGNQQSSLMWGTVSVVGVEGQPNQNPVSYWPYSEVLLGSNNFYDGLEAVHTLT